MKRLIKECSLGQQLSYRLLMLFYKKKEFNGYGLRYSMSMLGQIKPHMYTMPLEFLATFSDGICVQMVDEKDDSMIGIEDPTFLHYDMMNATSFGNTAYIAMHHHDEAVRTHYFNKLQDCFDRHREKLKNERTK